MDIPWILEDFIQLPGSCNSPHGSETDTPSASNCEAKRSGSLPPNLQLIDAINGENETILNELHASMETFVPSDAEEVDMDIETLPICAELTESVKIGEKASVGTVQLENVSVAVHSEIGFTNLEKDETLLIKNEKDANSLSGVKRPRMTVDEQQTSVHVIYNSLPRKSKQKLEELLQHWSQWHSRSCSPSSDSSAILKSGEQTYFPALHVGSDKPSSITFWVDNKTKTQSNKEFIPLDGTSVPLYDRGYSIVLTSPDGSSSRDGRVEGSDGSRCFNCGSYSHALKNCPKPWNNVAVNSTRNQHKSRKNPHANSRNSTRYYQSPGGGKYDDLIPGVLHAETRQLMGLGVRYSDEKELDPPPWLYRMRELGYPPGYLDPDVEDQPSGLTIVDDEDNKEELEEGEILEEGFTEPSKKMTVKFPGINAPIPENANERLWASPSSSNSYQRKDDDLQCRYNHHSTENSMRWHHSERRWLRDLDDGGPPGCEAGTSPSLSNHFYR